MELELKEIKCEHTYLPECIKGRGWFDYLDLSQVGYIFVVGWEDSAHHYWHNRYFTTLQEAVDLYNDYSKNGIPSTDIWKDEEDEFIEVRR